MKEEFIPYKEALALKELGFDDYVEYYKDSDDELFDMRTPNDAPAILWQQAFRWLAKEHSLYINWEMCFDNGTVATYEGFVTDQIDKLEMLRVAINIVKLSKDE